MLPTGARPLLAAKLRVPPSRPGAVLRARLHERLRGLRIVVAGRTDPPLPLARLRARGELTEIRVGDLRCTPAEVPRW